MIRLETGDRSLAIIEPGNINRMKAGHPLVIPVSPEIKNVYVIFTPDMAWLQAEIEARDATKNAELLDLIAESAKRSEVDR